MKLKVLPEVKSFKNTENPHRVDTVIKVFHLYCLSRFVNFIIIPREKDLLKIYNLAQDQNSATKTDQRSEAKPVVKILPLKRVKDIPLSSQIIISHSKIGFPMLC
jgi:hypothetical protein